MIKPYLLTSSLKRAIEQNRFILVRHFNGYLYGINCKIPFRWLQDNEETVIIGWRSCSFHEYLTYKIPFTK